MDVGDDAKGLIPRLQLLADPARFINWVDDCSAGHLANDRLYVQPGNALQWSWQ